MQNPTKAIFKHDDRASATGYEVDAIDSAGKVIRTVVTDLGFVDGAGDVVVEVNMMPLPVGSYRFVVRATNAGFKSPSSGPSVEPFERVPGPPGTPRAA